MTPVDEPVRIFIGSGDASLLERKTLVHSIRRHTRRRLDIRWFNGTTGTIESESGEKLAAPALPVLAGHAFATEFSLFRYLVPRLCGHEGRAIYLDSDMVVLADVGELFDTPLSGAHFAARPNAYPEIAPERWALSAMVIDCSTCRFDLDTILGLVAEGRFTYAEFSQMGRRARKWLPYEICPLPEAWNSFDVRDPSTRLVHYTDLDRQPWRYRYHPHGDAWFESFFDARRAGLVTEADIDLCISKGYVRPDVRLGNRGADTLASRALGSLHDAWLLARDARRRLARAVAGENL